MPYNFDIRKPALDGNSLIDLDGQPLDTDELSNEQLSELVGYEATPCKAQTTAGYSCRNAAWPESDFCPWHGGNAKLARAAGTSVRKAIDRSLRLIPDDSILDPYDLLARAAARSAKLADVVADLLSTIEPEDWEMETPQGMAIRPAFKMYQQMLKQTIDAARLLQKAGIDEHRVRVDQARLALQLRAMKVAFQAGIDEMRPSEAELGRAMAAMLREFERVVTAAPSVASIERGD